MTAQEEIINKVANSTLVTFNLEEYYHQGERVLLDIKDQLYQGMILREKDFRDFVKQHDWSQHQDKSVAIYCSVDAVVPTWAYMLLTTRLEPFAHTVVFGDLDDLEVALFREALAKVDPQDFKDAKIVIKGCSKVAVPTTAYVEITRLLRPVASSIMYGEPCSTVPIYKRPRPKK